MYCSNCGSKILDGANFCGECGTPLILSNQNLTSVIDFNQKENGPWKTFARAGRILSIISISSFWLFGIPGLLTGIPGIVFSVLGKKSQIYYNSSRGSMKRSIWGTVLSFIFFIAIMSVM